MGSTVFNGELCRSLGDVRRGEEKKKKVVRSVECDWGVNGESSGEGAEWGVQ